MVTGPNVERLRETLISRAKAKSYAIGDSFETLGVIVDLRKVRNGVRITTASIHEAHLYL